MENQLQNRRPDSAHRLPRIHRYAFRVHHYAALVLWALVATCVPSVGQSNSQSTSALNTFNSVTSSQEDFLIGKGTKGPYTLAWSGLRAGSDSVARDGVLLQRGVDYTLDSVAGAVSFTAPLLPQQIAKVDYQCDPVTAAPNSASVIVPFAWDLIHSGKSNLTFNSLFRNDPAIVASKETPLLSSLNWVGNTRFLTDSTLKSGLYLDLRGGDWLDRSAVNLAEASKLRYADISLQLSRAGKHFLGGAASGLTPGKEILELLTTLHPSSMMSFVTTLRETTILPDLIATPGSAPTTTREVGALVTFNLPMNTKLQAGRTETSVTTPGLTGVNTTTDTVKIDSDLPDKTHLAGAFTAVSSQPTSGAGAPASGTAAYTQNGSLQVTTKAVDQVTITGSLKNNLSPSGATGVSALSVEATPFAKDKKENQLAKLKIKGSVQSSITPAGPSNSSSAQVEIPNLPIAQTSLTGGITHSADPTKTQTVGLLDASAKPSKFLEVNGGVRVRDSSMSDNTPDPNGVNTYKMKVLFGPSKLMKLTGSLASNPDAADGTVNRSIAQSIGLESDLNLFKFTSSIGSEQDYATSRLTNNLLFGIDLRMSPRDLLTTAWESHSTQDTALNETSIYRLAYTHKLGSTVDVSLSGSMTQTAVNGIAAASGNLLKAEAKIGLHF
jgi:hypothetical protein